MTKAVSVAKIVRRALCIVNYSCAQRMGLCAVADRSSWQPGRKKPFLG